MLFMSAPARPKSAVICFPMLRSFVHLSRDETPVGSWLSFDMRQILNPYPHYYSLAFAFSNILYPRPHRLVLRPPYPKGRHWAYPVPLVHQSNLGTNSYADGATSTVGITSVPTLDRLPFGPGVSAAFTCSNPYEYRPMLTLVHFCLPYCSTLARYPLSCW